MDTTKTAEYVRHFFSPGAEPNVHVCNLCRAVRKQNVSHSYANLTVIQRSQGMQNIPWLRCSYDSTLPR